MIILKIPFKKNDKETNIKANSITLSSHEVDDYMKECSTYGETCGDSFKYFNPVPHNMTRNKNNYWHYYNKLR